MRVTTILLALATTLAIAIPAPDPGPAAVVEPRANEDSKNNSKGNSFYGCDFISLNPKWNHMLIAKCPRSTGQGESTMVWSSLNLNHCLINRFGFLRWHKNGQAMNTCRDCKLTSLSFRPTLHCNCDRRTDQPPQETSISLRDGIWNDNGTLKCRPIVKTYKQPVPPFKGPP